MDQKAIVVDFETHPIQLRPHYPPQAVGVAISLPGEPSRYYGWGHADTGPGSNNASIAEGLAALGSAIDSGAPLLFHNAKFDLDVLDATFAANGRHVPIIDPRRVHDTMWMLFLADPRVPTFGLKESAQRLCGEPPAERDNVDAWLSANQILHPALLEGYRPGKPGAWISTAPASVVAPYACGDVDRTRAIARVLVPAVFPPMAEAYEREQRLLPTIRRMEADGVVIDLAALRSGPASVGVYQQAMVDVSQWIEAKLGGRLNLDSGRELASRLIAKGLADEALLGRTAGGAISTSREAIMRAVSDPQISAALAYRGALATCVSTFIGPWYEMALACGGRVHPSWHTTRTDNYGARTGRLSSSSPNFMNIPKSIPSPWRCATNPAAPEPPIPLPPLPDVRRYVIPRCSADALYARDYAQQEPRLLAHFCGGDLLEAYRKDPWVDYHSMVQRDLSAALGQDVPRKRAKAINLGVIYGQGVARMAASMGVSTSEAVALRDATLRRYPELGVMQREMRRRARAYEPIRTWGGRLYYCEEPRIEGGVEKTFEYRMVNTLIQGSAADVTKQAVVQLASKMHASWSIVALIHDEIVVSAPASSHEEVMTTMAQAMVGVDVDVPMLSEGKMSTESWAAMTDYDKGGQRVKR